MTNKKLESVLSVFSNEECHVEDYIDNSAKTCLVLKLQENLTNLFNEFNNLSCDENNNSENIINYDIDEIQTLNKLNNKWTQSGSHVNSCFHSKNIEGLEYLLNSANINFDVVAITETRIVEGKTPVSSLNLMNYSHEFCSTELSAGGTLVYICNHLS